MCGCFAITGGYYSGITFKGRSNKTNVCRGNKTELPISSSANKGIAIG